MICPIGAESLRYIGGDIQEIAMNRVADDRDTLLTPSQHAHVPLFNRII
jgi:hypothetical protein